MFHVKQSLADTKVVKDMVEHIRRGVTAQDLLQTLESIFDFN